MKIYSSRYNPKDHPLSTEEMRTYNTLKQFVGKDIWIRITIYSDRLFKSMGHGQGMYIRLLRDCGPMSNFVFNYSNAACVYIEHPIDGLAPLSDIEVVLSRTKAKCADLIKISEPLEVITTEELINAYGYDIDELPEYIKKLL